MLENLPLALRSQINSLQNFWQSKNFDPQNKSLLLAVSSGLDSMVMLHFFQHFIAISLPVKLSVAHINHHLRQESSAEEVFLQTYCEKAKIPFYTKALNPKTKLPRQSLEMWARKARYGFFAELSQAHHFDFVLTAHHRDDVIETFFQRLGRGSTLRGLCAIPFQRKPNIVRPLLSWSKVEIQAYAQYFNLRWKEDHSNQDIRIDRNWYRHQFIPSLEKENADLKNRIWNMACSLREIWPKMENLLSNTLIQFETFEKATLSSKTIDELIANQEFDYLALGIEKLYKTASNTDVFALSHRLLEEFCRQWLLKKGTLHLPLSPYWSLKEEHGKVLCIKNNATIKAEQYQNETTVLNASFTKQEFIWQWGRIKYHLMMEKFPKPMEINYPLSSDSVALFDADVFSSTLNIRTKHAGDRFSPFGVSSHHRKLKVFLNEKKIPLEKREALPLIMSQDIIAWIPGYGNSDFFKVGEDTRNILKLVLQCEIL